jgi:ATP synthase protein I
MTNNVLRKRIQNQAYKIVLWQLAGVAILAILAFIFFGTITGLSVLMGGLAYGLPNLVFVWRVFRFSGAAQMTQFLAAFFIGEMLKLFFSAILFLVIVKTLPLGLLSVLVGFMGAIVSFWIVCFLLFGVKKGSGR